MLDWPWADIAGVGVILLASLVGVVLTVITLPGTWVPIVVAAGVKLWQPELVPWWAILVALALAVIAEVIEFAACALGASRAGATRRGAIGAMVGSFIGAIVGSALPPFPVGTILGGVVGAAGGALIGERTLQRCWRESGKAAMGAAIGRTVATLTKAALAGVIGVLLSLTASFGAFEPG
ncbi:MAG: DUF456 domain-containing protein [Planctomycetota bacterium]|nr:DUF456 domain-containing protein [Planctomycetota bacterium]